MAKLKFEHLKTVTSRGLSPDEAQERIHTVITDSIGEGRAIEETGNGITCVTTPWLVGACRLYYFIESRDNKHSIEVAHDFKGYVYLLTGIGIIIFTLINILFLHLKATGSVILGVIGAIAIIATLEIAGFKARKNARIDFVKIERALSAAEKDGTFSK